MLLFFPSLYLIFNSIFLSHIENTKMRFLIIFTLLAICLFGSIESRFGVGSRTGFAGFERWGYNYRKRKDGIIKEIKWNNFVDRFVE